MANYPTPAAVRAMPGGGLTLGQLATAVRRGSFATLVDALWVPAVSAILILLVGVIGYQLKQPWLFAGLGPTALLLATNPEHDTARFHAVVVGHLTALACAWLVVMLFSASGAPAILSVSKMPLARVYASAAAIALLAVVQPALCAYHPPAAATALLVTLGAYSMKGKVPLGLMGGVLAVAIVGVGLQQLRRRRAR